MSRGVTLWFSGLSGSGKTTLCRRIQTYLANRGIAVELLDGDEIRPILAPDLGFSREERQQNIERAAYVAKLLSRNGVIVLCSFITPYHSMRHYLRQTLNPYIEVYVRCSLEECIRRDVKGLYKKALQGQIHHFTGISDLYEEPELAEITIDTERMDEEKAVMVILEYLRRRQYIE